MEYITRESKEPIRLFWIFAYIHKNFFRRVSRNSMYLVAVGKRNYSKEAGVEKALPELSNM